MEDQNPPETVPSWLEARRSDGSPPRADEILQVEQMMGERLAGQPVGAALVRWAIDHIWILRDGWSATQEALASLEAGVDSVPELVETYQDLHECYERTLRELDEALIKNSRLEDDLSAMTEELDGYLDQEREPDSDPPPPEAA